MQPFFLSLPFTNDFYFDYKLSDTVTNTYVVYADNYITLSNTTIYPSNIDDKLFTFILDSYTNTSISSITSDNSVFTLNTNNVVTAKKAITYDTSNTNPNNIIKMTVTYTVGSNTSLKTRVFFITVLNFTNAARVPISYKSPATIPADPNDTTIYFNEPENKNGLDELYPGTNAQLKKVVRNWFMKIVNGGNLDLNDISELTKTLLTDNCTLNRSMTITLNMLTSIFDGATVANQSKYSPVIRNTSEYLNFFRKTPFTLENFSKFSMYGSKLFDSGYFKTGIDATDNAANNALSNLFNSINKLINDIQYKFLTIPANTTIQYKLQVIKSFISDVGDTLLSFNAASTTLEGAIKPFLVPLNTITPSFTNGTAVNSMIGIDAATVLTLDNTTTNTVTIIINDGKGNNGLKFRVVLYGITGQGVTTTTEGQVTTITSKYVTDAVFVKQTSNLFQFSFKHGDGPLPPENDIKRPFIQLEAINSSNDYMGTVIRFTKGTTAGNATKYTVRPSSTHKYFSYPPEYLGIANPDVTAYFYDPIGLPTNPNDVPASKNRNKDLLLNPRFGFKSFKKGNEKENTIELDKSTPIIFDDNLHTYNIPININSVNGNTGLLFRTTIRGFNTSKITVQENTAFITLENGSYFLNISMDLPIPVADEGVNVVPLPIIRLEVIDKNGQYFGAVISGAFSTTGGKTNNFILGNPTYIDPGPKIAAAPTGFFYLPNSATTQGIIQRDINLDTLAF